MMKRLIAILLVAVMAISLAACGAKEPAADEQRPAATQPEKEPAVTEAAKEESSGAFEGAVTEQIVRGYKVADESDFSYDETTEGVRITGYLGKDTIVVIPEKIAGKPVVGMSIAAFGNECTVRGVMVPSGVKELPGAFANNAEIEVVIWESAEIAGANLFNGCGSLHTVILGDQLQSIGENAFSVCYTLEELYIPATVVEIDPAIAATVFSFCESLTIVGEAGSYIESFCAEQGIPFKAA